MTTAAIETDVVSNEIPKMMPHFLFQLFQDHKVDPSQILIVNDNPKSVLTAASVSRSSSSCSDRTRSNVGDYHVATLDTDSDSIDQETIAFAKPPVHHQHHERWGPEPVAESLYDSDSVLLARQRSSVQLMGEPFKVKRTDKWMGDCKPNSDSRLSMPQRKSSLESASIEANSQRALETGAAVVAGKDTAPQRPPRKGKRPSKMNSMGSEDSSTSSDSIDTKQHQPSCNAYLSQSRAVRKQGRQASLNNSTHAQKAAWAAAIGRSPPRPAGRKQARRSSMDNAFITTEKAMELNFSNHSAHSSSSSNSSPAGRKQRRASLDNSFTKSLSTMSLDVSTHRPLSKSPPRPSSRRQARRSSLDNAYTMKTSSTLSMDTSTYSQPPPRPPSKSPPFCQGRKQARRASMDTALATAIRISSAPFSSSNTKPPASPATTSFRTPPRPTGHKQARRASMDTAFSGMRTATTNTFSTLYSAPSSIAASLIQRHRRNHYHNRKSPGAPVDVTPPTPRLKKKTKPSLSPANSASGVGGGGGGGKPSRNSSQSYAKHAMAFALP